MVFCDVSCFELLVLLSIGFFGVGLNFFRVLVFFECFCVGIVGFY